MVDTPVYEYEFPCYEPAWWGIYPPFRPQKTEYRTGWVCPKCGAVMSPDTKYCVNCTQINFTISC